MPVEQEENMTEALWACASEKGGMGIQEDLQATVLSSSSVSARHNCWRGPKQLRGLWIQGLMGSGLKNKI